MGKNDPKPGWSKYTPHKKSNPSGLPPELQDPEFVAKVEAEEAAKREQMMENISNGANGNQESRAVDLNNRDEVFMAVKSQINSNDFLFTSIEEVLDTLSIGLNKAAKSFDLENDEELKYEVRRRFAEVRSHRMMEASKDSRNFTTIFKAVLATSDQAAKLGVKTKDKSSLEGITIHMESRLTDNDIRNAKDEM